MLNMTCENPADELVLALTHGPIPGGIQEWEILESWVDGDCAVTRLLVDGKVFTLTVAEED